MIHKAQSAQLAAAAEAFRLQTKLTSFSTPPSPTSSPPNQNQRLPAQVDEKNPPASLIDLTVRRQDLSSSTTNHENDNGSIGPPSTSSNASSYGNRNSCGSPRSGQETTVDSS